MFVVKFDTDNAAFEDGNAPAECARILRAIADKLTDDYDYPMFQTIHDVNGNDVGRWKLDLRRTLKEAQ